MASGLFQTASFSMKVSATDPTTQSLDITGRARILVDRMHAFLRVEPTAAGAAPVLDDVRLAERLLRARIALDRNDARVLTNGDLPVAALQQLDGGPIPVPPFELGGNETPTLKINFPANFLQLDPMKNYGDAYLEVIFYGQEA
ncbi:MAG TPA: hypothetical protein VFT46_06245 [Holophagaceae bacterium]|nr:hypothetical protein [Holophagaceae bacterium]